MATTAIATKTTLDGFFKEVYADTVQKLKPEDIFFLDDIPFKEGERLGNQYNQPVVMTLSHGITFAVSDSAPDLVAAVNTKSENAKVDGYQSILRERIGYATASRAASGGKAAFLKATQHIIETMRLSHMIKLEIQTLLGQFGLGTVSSVAGNVVTMTAATWAPGVWTGAEYMPIDIYTTATSGVLVKSTMIESVDLDARTITLSDASGVSANHVIFFRGAYGNEPVGILKALTTSSGLVFNINVGTYNMWKPVSYSAGSGTLTFNKIQQAAARARPKGMRGMVKCYINPRAFADLNAEYEVLRNFGGEQYKKNLIERGTQNFKFYGTSGVIEIQVHDIIPEGYAVGLLMDGSWKRLGSSEVTFNLPGTDGEYFFNLGETAGFEMRSFADFAPFCSRLGANFVITGIVNSA